MMRETFTRMFPDRSQKSDDTDLSPDDQIEYESMRNSFHQQQKSAICDRHSASFLQEIHTIMAFIERRPEDREKRMIAVGLAFSSFFVCVNTRQLKAFLGRCKSSINNGFQGLGYTSLKTKSKARSYLLVVLPSLAKDISSSRRWTIRYIHGSHPVFFPQRAPSPGYQFLNQKVVSPPPSVTSAVYRSSADIPLPIIKPLPLASESAHEFGDPCMRSSAYDLPQVNQDTKIQFPPNSELLSAQENDCAFAPADECISFW